MIDYTVFRDQRWDWRTRRHVGASCLDPTWQAAFAATMRQNYDEAKRRSQLIDTYRSFSHRRA